MDMWFLSNSRIGHYADGETTPFCSDMTTFLHSSDRIVEAEDIWMKLLEKRTDPTTAATEFKSKGAQLILRGAEEWWRLTLDGLFGDLRKGRIGPSATPCNRKKQYIRDLYDWNPKLPLLYSEKELPVFRHIQLLRGGVILDNVNEFYSGEAHVHAAAVQAENFFSFMRLMSVWCMYLCRLGFDNEVLAVICGLHAMGMANRAGNDAVAKGHGEQVRSMSTSIRKSAYDMLKEKC